MIAQLEQLTVEDLVSNLRTFDTHLVHQNEDTKISESPPPPANHTQMSQSNDRGRGWKI